MILVILTAILAVSGAAKLDRSYLPPPLTAKTAGGSPGDLQAPLNSHPSGSYTNDAEGVVVDAIAPGTRTSGSEPTGLGGPRASYGSTDSKVGEAAFAGPSTRIAPGFESIVGIEENKGGPSIRIAPGFSSIIASDGSDADKTKASTLKFANEIGLENYSYGFETDNGISIGENGVAGDGIKANGEYSYKGDDGKVYSVSYTADEGGYKPQGSHLPTPHPIPEEILKSLEQNAKEEAAGIVDDGSYDAHKYKDEGDYTSNNGADNNNRPFVGSGGATASGVFASHGNSGIKHNNQVAHASGNKFQGFGTSDGSTSFGIQGLRGQNQGLGFHSHSSQNQFSVQPGKSEGSSASAFATTNKNQGSVSGTPSLHSHPGLRLPGSLNSNAAYSSAATTGSGSASAFASSGPVGPGFKNQFSNTGSKFVSNAPSSATASASAQGPDVSAQALSTSSPSFEGTNFNKAPTHSAFGSNSYTQNKDNGLTNNEYLPPVNTIGSFDQTIHSSHGNGAASLPQNSAASGFILDKPNFNQPPQHSNTFIQGNSGQQHSTSGFPSRFGQTQSQTAFGKPTGQVVAGSTNARPEDQSKFSSSDAATAASSHGSQQPGVLPQTSFSSKPGQYTLTGSSFPSSTGQAQFSSTNTRPSVVSGPTPTKVPTTDLSTPFGPNVQGNFVSGQLSSSTPTQSTVTIPSNQLSNFGPVFPSHSAQYKPQTSQGSFGQTGSYDASFASSTSKPTQNQQQGSDNSYYYNQPIKPFVTPISQYQISGLGSATPTVSTQTGQYQDATASSHYNGLTQASISSFPSVAPTSATQFGHSQPSQLGVKPTIQSGGSSSQTNFGSTSNQQTFGQKPIVQSQSQFGQESSSHSDKTHTPSQQGTIYEYNKPSSPSQQGHTDSQVRPTQTSFGSQGNQFGNQQYKPFGSSSHSSSFQHTQSQGSTFSSQPQKPTSAFPSQFGQKPFGSSQTGSSYQQTQFSSVAGSQFGKKPSIQPGSSFQQTQFGTLGSQVEQKPLGSQIGSQLNQGTLYEYNKPDVNLPSDKEEIVKETKGSQSSQGSSSTFQLNQSNQSQKPQTNFASSQTEFISQQTQSGSQFGQKPQVKPITQIGSQYTQFGQKPQSLSGSSFTSNKGETEIGKKPFGHTQIGSTFSQTQTTFGAQPATQFGQKPHTNQVVGFGGTQTTSTIQQSQFGTSYGSQLGQKPQSIQGSSFSGKPSSITSSGSIYQQTQTAQSSFGSQPNIHFGQKPQSVGTVPVTPQVTSISQYGQKPATSQFTQGSGQQTQFSSFTGTQSAQKQGSQGSYFASSAVSQGQTQFGTKPSSQSSHTFSSPFGQKPNQATSLTNNKLGVSQTGSSNQNQFGSSLIHKFEQKPQLNQGSSLTATSGSSGQPTQSSLFGQKPTQTSSGTGTNLSQTQFGTVTDSKFVEKPQVAQGQAPTSQTGYNLQQTSSLGTLAVPQSAQKPQPVFTASKGQSAQTTQFGVKPFGSTQNTGSSYTQTQFGATGSQFSQKPQTTGAVSQTTTTFGQKPAGYQQTQFGSTLSSTQKPLSTQTNSFPSNTVSKGQYTIQSNVKPIGSLQTTGSNIPANQFGSTSGSHVGIISSNTPQVQAIYQYGTKPTGSQTLQQPQFGSSTGSYFGSTGSQSSQSGSGTVSSNTPQVQTISQYGTKPFNTQLTPGTLQQTQFGSSTNSKFSQNTGSQSQLGQTTQSGSQSQFGSLSSSQFGQKPQTSSGTVSTIAQVQPISQYDKKPFVHGSYQQTQFGLSSGSQASQNVGNQGQVQVGQKPFGSFSFQQTQLGSTGSKFGQQPTVGTQIPSSTFTQSSQSHFGTQTKKPSDNTHKPFQTQFSSIAQKPQSSATAFASSSGSFSGSSFGDNTKHQTNTFESAGQSQKPFGSSLTQTGQYTQTGQFGSQAQKPFGSSQSAFQQSQFSVQKPIGSQGSAFQIAQTVDQKTHSTQSSFHASAQSISHSSESLGSFEGYNYQKPQISTVSQFGDKSKPGSTPSTIESFEQSQSTVGSIIPSSIVITPETSSTQYGAQPTKPTVQFSGQQALKPYSTPSTQTSNEQFQTAAPTSQKFGAQPTQGAFVTSQKPSQTSGAYSQTIKQNTFGSTQSNFAAVGSGATPDNINLGSSVSTVQTPISIGEVNKQPSHSFVGKGEQFGGPREPPRFDDKTGYHY